MTAHDACPHLALLCRERRWKMSHAKRFAGQIKRSNLDVESRQQVRAKEELQALRKQAAFVGKEVGTQAELLMGLSTVGVVCQPIRGSSALHRDRGALARGASAFCVLHYL